MTMKLKKTLQIILALCLGLWMISCQQEHIKLTSPNGKLSLEFTLDEEGAPRYCLRHPDFITFLRHHIAHNDNQRVT